MLIETFKVFRDLAETGSFSKAAELNFITQSAVSQQIKNLEKTMGCTLVGRGAGRIRLTPAGLVYYKATRKVLTVYDDLLEQIKALAGTAIQGSVRIVTIYSAGTYVLPDYFQSFLGQHPDIKLDINYQKAGRIYDDILANRAEVGFIASPQRRKGLEIIPLQQESLVFICAPSHPLAAVRTLALDSIDGLDFVAFDPSAPTRTTIDRLLGLNGVRPRIRLESDNVEAIKSAVRTGTGVAIVPEAAVRNEAAAGTLVARGFSDADMRRPLCMLVSRRRKLSRVAALFLAHVRKPGEPPERRGLVKEPARLRPSASPRD